MKKYLADLNLNSSLKYSSSWCTTNKDCKDIIAVGWIYFSVIGDLQKFQDSLQLFGYYLFSMARDYFDSNSRIEDGLPIYTLFDELYSILYNEKNQNTSMFDVLSWGSAQQESNFPAYLFFHLEDYSNDDFDSLEAKNEFMKKFQTPNPCTNLNGPFCSKLPQKIIGSKLTRFFEIMRESNALLQGDAEYIDWIVEMAKTTWIKYGIHFRRPLKQIKSAFLKRFGQKCKKMDIGASL